MKKTLLVAAALLSLGVGSAFAGDGDPHAQPPLVTSYATFSQSTQDHRLFQASTRDQVNVYSNFGDQYARGQR
jgi:hypothetical protein